MVHTMNKPPKNFKDLVAGHFCNRAHDILMACKAHTEGIQFGCLHLRENGNKEACCIKFKNDVTSYIKRLVDAFNKIGAKEAIEVVCSAHIDVKIISSISPLPTHAEYKSRIDRLKEEVTNLSVSSFY
ncbi:ubiquitin-conjugating enzyme family protein [Tanacetum coccineum]